MKQRHATPPAHFKAEESVIGAVLVHGDLIKTVSPILKPADIDHPALRAIYGAMLDLDAAGNPIDLITVEVQLDKTQTADQLKILGGIKYLEKVQEQGISVHNVGYHARIVADAAGHRRLLEAAREIERRVAAGEAPADVRDSARAAIDGAVRVAASKTAPPPLAADAAAVDWARLLPPSVPTGLADLDRAIDGFYAEGAYALIGPTGRGKTGLALQMARAVAAHQPVVYFSSELSRRQVLARAAAPLLRRAWSNLYRLEPQEAPVLVEALAGLRLRVIEINRNMVLADAIAAVADAEGRAPFVVLDYLQHAARRLLPEDMRLATAALMDQMTEWARSSRSTALVLSATSRGFHRENENRSATDFVTAGKETGEVEYDAAGVFFLDCEPCPPGGTSPARLHVAKSRFQGTGATIGLRFDGAYGCFTCDRLSALSEDQRAALEAIEAGAESVEDIRKKLELRKEAVTQLVKVLHAQGLIERNPLRVVPRLVTP